MHVDGAAGWLIESSNAAGNAHQLRPVRDPRRRRSEPSARRSRTAPTAIGLGSGQCLALDAAALEHGHRRRKDGRDIGANILYRYQGGQPTTQPLWDPATGKFPCGAVVPGINDGAKRCTNIHERLNVNTNGCAFPAGYAG